MTSKRRPAVLTSIAVVGSIVVSVVLAGCSTQATTATSATSAATDTTQTTVQIDGDYTAAVGAILAANADWTTVKEDEWDASTAVDIDLASAVVDGVVTITDAGVYRLSGTLDGQVVVAAPDDALVVLILDGATITSDDAAAIDVQSADDVAIHLADGSTNTVSATVTDESADASAAIFSAADLTISGSGALSVSAGGVADGIASKDDLVVLGGDISVTAADDGLRGHDSLVIKGGTITVDADGDGLKSNQDEDETQGYVAVLGGTISLTAGDDGIDAQTDIVVADGALTVAAADDGLHSEVALAIGGGTVSVTTSEEGIESFAITIEGGTTSVVSNDDGLNASGGTSTQQGGMGGGMESDGGQTVTITGGSLTINAAGDGLDSNGSATMTGGTVVVYGPTNNGNGALDVNGTFTISGGELLAIGSSGMAVSPDTSSSQSFIAATAQASAGATVTIVDSSGATIAEFTTPKAIASVVYSSSAIVSGATYTVLVNGSTAGTATAGVAASGGMGGGMGGGNGGRP